MLSREEMLDICRRRDASRKGEFYIAVKSTGIVCNLGCPAKMPLEKNIVFFEKLDDAFDAGYRPCKRCMKHLWHDGEWSR